MTATLTIDETEVLTGGTLHQVILDRGGEPHRNLTRDEVEPGHLSDAEARVPSRPARRGQPVKGHLRFKGGGHHAPTPFLSPKR